jgi:hypothetical protein
MIPATALPGKFNWILLALYLLVVIRLWIMPMGSSFWLDETLTFWNVKNGIFEAVKRSSECPGQFQLYMAITALSAKIFGLSEFGLRLPSLVASIFSSYLMFLLGRRFVNTETGIFAAILFAALPEIVLEASNARPYALMLLFGLSAMWQLTRFHDSGQWRHATGYALSAALMVYVHYIALPFLLVTTFYSFRRLMLHDEIIKRRTLLMHSVLLSLILPLCYIILFQGKDSHILAFVGTPNIRHFILSIFTNTVIISICLVLTTRIVLRGRVTKLLPIFSRQTDCLMFYWLLIPITFVFSISIFSDYKIFVARYFLLSYPAVVLLVVGLIQKIRPDFTRHGVLLSICLYAVLVTGGNDFYPSLHHEDWRSAISAVNAVAENEEVTILFNSGLIETRQPGWEAQTADHHLLSPLAAYPVNANVIALPLVLDKQAQVYLEQTISKEVLSKKSFVVVHRGYKNSVNEWIQDYVQRYGFQGVMIENAQGVSIIHYNKV